jgi:hypothetical protein
MKAKSSLKALAAMVCTAALTLAASGTAQAHGDNIYWSIGMSSPGMQVGVSSAPPMVMYPPIYMAPRPVVYMPPVVYGPPGWRRHHGHHGGYQNYGYERHDGYGERGYEGHREGRRY